MDTPQTDATAAIDAFALAVMTSCGQLSLVIDHMHRFQANAGPAAGDEAVPSVLHRLLRDVLAPLVDDHGVDDVATAAQMLDSATRTIGDELFLVDVERLRGDR